jgi:hypothetical protein
VTEVRVEATITCPLCGFQKAESVPTDACHFFYQCEGCDQILRPLEGHCCVFCSYADKSCPPCQADAVLKQELLRVAFMHLLAQGEPITVTELAATVGASSEAVEESVATRQESWLSDDGHPG